MEPKALVRKVVTASHNTDFKYLYFRYGAKKRECDDKDVRLIYLHVITFVRYLTSNHFVKDSGFLNLLYDQVPCKALEI